MKRILFVFLALILTGSMLVTSGCSRKSPAAAAPRIRVADQFGLGYAPFTIMLEKKFLEKHLPGIQIERKKFGSGSAVREAMIAGDLDVGFMGIPPFLVGWDKGVDWKIAGALGSMPLLLLTYREEVEGIGDLGPMDKIALPGPGSNQHILLAMAAEKELGDARALDEFIVAMPHPDAATALLSRRDITCYYGAPPYQYELLQQPGIKQIADAFTAFGEPFSYIVAVAAESFYRKQPQTYQAFCAALEESLHFIRANPEEAAEILARVEKTVPAATYKEYLTWPGTNWDITPRGIMRYAEYMQKAGYIKKTPTSWQEATYPNLHSLKGS